jgi:hypothetical protein
MLGHSIVLCAICWASADAFGSTAGCFRGLSLIMTGSTGRIVGSHLSFLVSAGVILQSNRVTTIVVMARSSGFTTCCPMHPLGPHPYVKIGVDASAAVVAVASPPSAVGPASPGAHRLGENSAPPAKTALSVLTSGMTTITVYPSGYVMLRKRSCRETVVSVLEGGRGASVDPTLVDHVGHAVKEPAAQIGACKSGGLYW